MLWIILAGIGISVGCYLVWSYADMYLFTYLGEVETENGIEKCWGYDAMSIPARIVAFMCAVAAMVVFWLTWFSIYDILFL